MEIPVVFCRDLRFNHFEEIPNHAFAGLAQLTTLFLNENEIAFIQKDAFQDGPANLRFLYLNNNRISRLPAELFQPLTKLEAM